MAQYLYAADYIAPWDTAHLGWILMNYLTCEIITAVESAELCYFGIRYMALILMGSAVIAWAFLPLFGDSNFW